MSKTVKLLNIANVGTVLATLQSESNDSIIVKNPAQLATDESGAVVIIDYLDAIVTHSTNTVFFKYNIISVNDPSPTLEEAYVNAIAELEKEDVGLILPSSKIIL